MNALLVLFVLATGMGLSAQPLVNARAALALGHPIFGAMFSVVLSSLTLLAIVLLLRLGPPDLRALAAAPPWAWTGGVIGAFVVLAALMAAPRLGSATTVAILIAGQLACSLAIDHFGLLGVPEHPLDGKRLAGAVFLVAGVALIRWV